MIISVALLQNMKDESDNAEHFFTRVARHLDYPDFTNEEIKEIKKLYKVKGGFHGLMMEWENGLLLRSLKK